MQRSALVLVAILVESVAWGIPIAKGTVELRPVMGVTADLTTNRRQESQLQVGLDGGYSFGGPWSVVVGGWAGFGDDFVGAEVHLGVKYRLLDIRPKVAPFFVGGVGFTMGFHPIVLFDRPMSDPSRRPIPGSDDALLGPSVRVGGGVDYFVTERVLAGVQMIFDLGYRFSPGTGFLGSVQVTAGVSFLL